MDGVKVTFELPAELVERAKAVGLEIEAEQEKLIELLEAQIRRREAATELRAFAREFQSLPPETKPSAEEIAAEIRAYWANQSAHP